MLPQNFRASVLVRTRGVESLFQELLRRLSRQTLQPSEIVVADNFSSKENLEAMRNILSSAKKRLFNSQVSIKLVPIMDSEFSHPYSTNAGVCAAKGDFVCITNGHSLPLSDSWLEAGVLRFRDSGVAGVGGYTVSHKNGTIWEKVGYDWLWKKRNEVSKVHTKDDFFSTINCILRRSLWEEYPFDERLPSEIQYSKKYGGEDFDWAMEMEARGYKIVVEPKFVVCHSHGETFTQLTSKYVVWQKIRNEIRSFKRPRKSYTKLERVEPLYYDL
jgi:cellulose synthase/poly-beta-1,6-N-acetylglucosamine synthase-like glycosyltransferase